MGVINIDYLIERHNLLLEKSSLNFLKYFDAHITISMKLGMIGQHYTGIDYCERFLKIVGDKELKEKTFCSSYTEFKYLDYQSIKAYQLIAAHQYALKKYEKGLQAINNALSISIKTNKNSMLTL